MGFERVVFVVLFDVVDEDCIDILFGVSFCGVEVPLMATPSRGLIPIVGCGR